MTATEQGFRLGRTFALEFEQGTYLDGALIRSRSAPIRVVEQVGNAQMGAALGLILPYITSWNLETEEGEPLPIEEEAVMSHMEPAVRKAIVTAWYGAATGVSAPLDPPSIDGAEVTSLPMDIQTPNQPQ